MESTEAKVLVTVVGLIALLTGVLWVAFFPAGGLMTALFGVVLLVWSIDQVIFGNHHSDKPGSSA